ncbi:uncharacterized protein LOC108734867 isoform X2 [Agrilus planipennis]|uniref:Protein zwilch n=1 Tax=Agrilus planipennis TaxID=224129 RepID=A0A1W4WNN4_AGRPL|nr:uncharacterized protein LOC108734867 isoform X2 [Agrilus planipennis]
MVCSSEVENVIKYTKTPTYLKHLTRSNEEIILICGQKPKSVNINSDDDSNEDITVNNELDLTGSPLTLDLSKEDSVCSDIIDPINWWTADEAKHYPINLQHARKYLNLLYRSKGSDNSGDATKKYFCLCDGKNEGKVVIIGSCKNDTLFSRTLVYDYGCLSSLDQTIKVDSMKKKHMSNANCSTAEIDNNVCGLYSIFGKDLSNAHVSTNSEMIGSVLIDAQWKNCEVDIPQYKSELQLKMQLIAGHTQSLMQKFWNNIVILHYLIDIKLKNKATFLENDMYWIEYKSFTKLTQLITEILNEPTFKHSNTVKDRASTSLSYLITSIAEIKEETIFDKLWRLLISCKEVSDLKDCFSIIFEDIAQNNTSRLLMTIKPI